MPSPKQIQEARKQVLLSYAHKAVLMMIACVGFGALRWLGDQTTWEVGPDVQRVVRQAVTHALATSGHEADGVVLPPCPGVPDTPRSFGSREQLISAMQDRAETCVWANFRANIDQAERGLEEIGRRPPKDPHEFAGVAEFITKEDALARITAGAARQAVRARLASMALRPKLASEKNDQQSSWRRMTAWLGDRTQDAASEDSGRHVLYEMIWYAALLLGVVASSILFVIVLTALPITTGEGYWTSRIGKILSDLPLGAKSMLVVPLAAAAIGGGTLAGAVATTQPGGQARAPYEARPPVSPAYPTQSGRPNLAIDQRSYRGNDTHNLYPLELAWPSSLDKLESINDSLTELSVRAKSLVGSADGLVGSAARAEARLGYALRSVESRLDRIAVAESETGSKVGNLQQAVATLRSDVGRGADAVAPLAPTIRDLSRTMAEQDRAIVAALSRVESIESRSAEVFSQSLAQTGEVDTRPVLKRIIGPTAYHVGPAVPALMCERVDTPNPGEVEAMREALTVMQRQAQQPLRAFEDLLRGALQEAFSKRQWSKERAEELLQANLPALRRVCALPRQ